MVAPRLPVREQQNLFADDDDHVWYSVSDKDPRAVQLYLRHYSARSNRSKPRQMAAQAKGREGGIVGTSDYLALMTRNYDALFVWKRYPDGVSRDGKQRGVVCSVFRNEGPTLSSALIREADSLAWRRWPGERHYTYVWDDKVKTSKHRGRNPVGWCFQKADWRVCGRNADGRLTVLERLPDVTQAEAPPGPALGRPGGRVMAADRAELDEMWAARAKRENFIAAWRSEHPDQTYSDRWKCPLCGYVVQVADAGDRPIASRVMVHIDVHGQDWIDYEQAGQMEGEP